MKITYVQVIVKVKVEGEPLARYGTAEVAPALLDATNGDDRLVLGHAAEIALERAKSLKA